MQAYVGHSLGAPAWQCLAGGSLVLEHAVLHLPMTSFNRTMPGWWEGPPWDTLLLDIIHYFFWLLKPTEVTW